MVSLYKTHTPQVADRNEGYFKFLLGEVDEMFSLERNN